LKQKEKKKNVLSQKVKLSTTRPSQPSLDKSALGAAIRPSWTCIYRIQLDHFGDYSLIHHHITFCVKQEEDGQSQRRESKVKGEREDKFSPLVLLTHAIFSEVL